MLLPAALLSLDFKELCGPPTTESSEFSFAFGQNLTMVINMFEGILNLSDNESPCIHLVILTVLPIYTTPTRHSFLKSVLGASSLNCPLSITCMTSLRGRRPLDSAYSPSALCFFRPPHSFYNPESISLTFL